MSTILLTSNLQLHYPPKILEKVSACLKYVAILFKQALLTGVFHSEWKKRNIVPIHKKSDKQNIKNYGPVSLLPICVKIFERLNFNEMLNYIVANKLISKNPGTSVSTNCYQLPTKFLHLLIMD